MNLRSVDHANHAAIAMSWNRAVEPDGIATLNSDDEVAGFGLDWGINSTAQGRVWLFKGALNDVMSGTTELESHSVALLRRDGGRSEAVSACTDCYVEVCG